MKGNHVALTRCYFCGEADKILLCAKYRPDGRGGMVPAKDMSEFDGKVIDKEPCPKCQEHMKNGVILISVSDDSEDGSEPYRTGGWWVVKDEAIKRMVKPPELAEKIISQRVTFVPNQACKILHLPGAEQLVNRE